MRTRTALTVTLALAALVALSGGCSSGSQTADGGAAGAAGIPVPPEPDGGFGDATEGQSCVDGADCVEGLFCLPLFAPTADDSWLRCARGCNTGAHCGDGTCFGKFGVAPGDSPQGFCGTEGGIGEACNSDALKLCGGDSAVRLVCYSDSGAEGRCYEVCVPGTDGACSQAGESCADFFGTDDFGICVTPSVDHRCDLATTFCATGEFCTSLDPDQPGHCFPRCAPLTDPACGEGLACAAPFVDPALGVCVAVAQTNMPCAPTEYSFCGAADICVDEAADGLRCRRDCTADPTVCEQFAAERTCRALEDEAQRSICAP